MADDATQKVETKDPSSAPVLPLRDIVVFPHMIVPLFVGREKSVRALEEVMNDEKQILLLTQKNAAEDDPTAEGLHTIGTLATVLQLLKLPDHIEVFPAHFGGAACGKGLSGKPGSTIGFERRFNPALQLTSKAEFIRFVLADLPPQPEAFADNRRRNIEGR